jgi:hypothetical protein
MEGGLGMNHEEKYKAALDSHKHYDSLSMTVVAGMFAVTYGSYSLQKDLINSPVSTLIYYVGAIAIVLLYLLYRKLSYLAIIARNVTRELELSDGSGVSEVYDWASRDDDDSKKKFLLYAIKKDDNESLRLSSVRAIVGLLAFGQIFILLVSSRF